MPWIRAFIFKLPKQSNLLVGVGASVVTLLGVLPLDAARPATLTEKIGEGQHHSLELENKMHAEHVKKFTSEG